jgi:prepilin-type N-terminal cleavage/methylation domain-containing protein
MTAIRTRSRRSRQASPAAGLTSSGERGFTLLELMITLAITAVVMVVVLTSLDAHSRVARLQVDIGDVQQTLRVGHRAMTHLVRMAGRSGLPRRAAVLVDQNVGDDVVIGAEPVAPLTDILTVRGALRSPIFRADSDDPAVFTIAGTKAHLRIDSVTNAGFVQPLDSLEALLQEDGSVGPEAVLLTSRQSDSIYAVVELESLTFEDLVLDIQNRNVTVRRANLTFNIDPASDGHAAQYMALSSNCINLPAGAPCDFPANLTSVLLMAVIEEHRFYVRRDYAVPGDDTSPPRPKLCRARMFPNTDAVWGGPENAAIEIADNVFDLQVSYGVDLDVDGIVEVAMEDGTPLDADEDEWLWNDAEDDDSLDWFNTPLHFVRVTTLAHTRGPDRQYISPSIDSIEDRVYGESDPTSPGEIAARRYRRRQLESVIDLRNL